MALKMYVKLQTPTIELKINSVDGSGAKDTMYVGYKRYDLDASELKIKALQDVYEQNKDDEERARTILNKFIKDEVVYIKNAEVITENTETGKTNKVSIPDTRLAKPIETLWDTPEECLDVLLDAYLSCGPTRVSLNDGLTTALVNAEFREGKLKNL